MKYPNTIKILGNILVAALSPFFVLILKAPKVFKAIQTGFYSEGYTGYPDYRVDNFTDILIHIYPKTDEIYFFAIILLVLILTPLALYKERKYEHGKRLSFLKKWLILSVPFCVTSFIFFGAYLGMASPPTVFYALILMPSGFALYLSILLYFIIDIWVEKSLKNKTS